MASVLLPALALFSVSASATVAGSTNALRQTDGPTGDFHCGRNMCVNATLSGNVVNYSLTHIGGVDPGWLGIGFGTSMTYTPMVVMWPNSDGSVTLSQRITSTYSMPHTDSRPPRTAVLSSGSRVAGGTGEFAFSIPWDHNTKTDLIYAFAAKNINHLTTSAPDSAMQPHMETGYAHLDLSKPIVVADEVVSPKPSLSAPKSSPPKSSSASTLTSAALPLSASQRFAFVHAIFCTVGFLVFLPAGALVARWARTFTPAWYTAHWIAQFAAAGPAILIGVVLGVEAVNKSRSVVHLNDAHKKWGAALVALYALQCALGAFIHWIKPKNSTGRPLQNYLHAVVGIVLVGLGFYQVGSGLTTEWPQMTGREEFIPGAEIAWYIWAMLLPILYFAGLSLLPKQLKQERGVVPGPQVTTEKPLPSGEYSSLLAESADVEGEDYQD